MCGFCGIVYTDPNRQITDSEFSRTRDTLTHRGPDDAGLYTAPGVMLGSRRLAILDLSEQGHMPMATLDRRYWLAYNGEIYNFKDFRDELKARGYRFHSSTDTEVLLYLYAEYGAAMLERLNGMFAFAVWDSLERRLFIARDRLGVKPLYYAEHDGALYFASEEKALFAAGVPRRFDHDAWPELLCFRYTAGERTPFLGIRRLLPGHYMTWHAGEHKIRRWWSLAEKARSLREQLPADPVEWYRDTFDDAVRLRQISDVPVGVLLSGGLDSSSVAASLASQKGSGVASFTVRFDESDYDEGPLARQVVERWRLEGHELVVAPKNLLAQLKKAAWFNDEPQVHGNDVHLFAISEYAKPRVTVLLSGEGADETLGGYVRYQPLRFPFALEAARRVLPLLDKFISLNGRLGKLGRFLEMGTLDRFVMFNACEILPGQLADLHASVYDSFSYREEILTEAANLYPGDLARQAMYSDQHTFLCSVLDRNDRMTMGASIECRVPFLDYRLVEMAAALPSSVLFKGRRTKHLLRAASGSRLPTAILNHRKWGFGVPWKKYFREISELKESMAALSSHSLIVESPLNCRAVDARLSAFLNGDDRAFAVLLQIFMTALSWDAATPSEHFAASMADRGADLS